jgi:hypothetical protein
LHVSVGGRYGIKVKLGTIAPLVMKLEAPPWEVPEGVTIRMWDARRGTLPPAPVSLGKSQGWCTWSPSRLRPRTAPRIRFSAGIQRKDSQRYQCVRGDLARGQRVFWHEAPLRFGTACGTAGLEVYLALTCTRLHLKTPSDLRPRHSGLPVYRLERFWTPVLPEQLGCPDPVRNCSTNRPRARIA